MKTGITVLGHCVFVFVAGAGYQGCSKKSEVGESCLKAEDCSSLRCVTKKCVAKAEAGQSCEKADDCSGSLKCLERRCVDTETTPTLDDVLRACWEFPGPMDPKERHILTFRHHGGQSWTVTHGVLTPEHGMYYDCPQQLEAEEVDGAFALRLLARAGDPQGDDTPAFTACSPRPGRLVTVRPRSFAKVEADGLRRHLFGVDGDPLLLTRSPCP